MSLARRRKDVTVRLAAGPLLLLGLTAWGAYPLASPDIRDVRLTDGFWFDRLETNRLVTLRTDLARCEETGRIANFTNAVARTWGTFKGIPFDDSDVYKVMEGAAYALATHPDPALERRMTELIRAVAGAQEPDGYLYTARTLGFRCDNPKSWTFGMMGPVRWSHTQESHELYNVGHLYEAAVAWQRATGRRDLLGVAVKSANLVRRTFGLEASKLRVSSGHPEIELALCKLAQATGERRYLDMAREFLEMRGRKDLRPDAGSAGSQDHLPVREQAEAIGHAVCAAYLYSGMTEVAALTDDRGLAAASDRLWADVVSRKLHLSGGIGARRIFQMPGFGELHEAFNGAYDLPNEDAYLETCAAIANALWNERLFRLHGEAKYMDVVERIIYNGFASGVSLGGDAFFYPNPLANRNGLGHAKHKPYCRSKWFGVSCCPVNIVRFMPQIPTFAYATDGKGTVYWNLFMSGEATVGGVRLACRTDYPWHGKATLTLASGPHPQPSTFNLQLSTLKIRIPGWAKGAPVPSDLYVQTEPASAQETSVAVNGRVVNGVPGADGYLTVCRKWKAGDVVELNLPMPVKRIRAHANVAQDRGRLAVERGPVVFCAEGADNGGRAFDATLPADATFAEETVCLGDRTFLLLGASNGLKLVPYCIWGNREPGNEMQVWLKEGK